MTEWIETNSGNRISSKAKLNGLDKISIKGNSTIHNAILNGDVPLMESGSAISIGKYCYIGANSQISCPLVKLDQYSRIKIGSYVVIGENCDICSMAIGSRVIIEDNCKLGDLCVVYDCCIIRKGTQIPPRTVIPPFSLVMGSGTDFKIKSLENGYKLAIETEAKRVQIIGRQSFI